MVVISHLSTLNVSFIEGVGWRRGWGVEDRGGGYHIQIIINNSAEKCCWSQQDCQYIYTTLFAFGWVVSNSTSIHHLWKDISGTGNIEVTNIQWIMNVYIYIHVCVCMHKGVTPSICVNDVGTIVIVTVFSSYCLFLILLSFYSN